MNFQRLRGLGAGLGLVALLGGCGVVTDILEAVGLVEEDPCPAAATLVAEAKASLEASMAGTASQTFGEQMDQIAAKFDEAAALCGTNQEAAFWAAGSQTALFLDSATTTDVLAKLGLGPFRAEVALENGFDAGTVIAGGTEDFVDISAAEVMNYAFYDFPTSFLDSTALLDGLNASFATNLTVPDNGSSKTLDIDYADAKVFQALFGMMQIPFDAWTLWSYPGLDEFFTANTTRNPTTGEIIDDVSPAEAEAYFQSAQQPLSVNQAGVEQISAAFATVFSALQTGINQLLAESDDQTDDLLVLTGENPEFDAQLEVVKFQLTVLAAFAGEVSAAFETSTPVAARIYRPIFTISSTTPCAPLASAPGTTNGQTFTPQVYRATVNASLKNMFQVAGDFWDNSQRATINLADGPNENDSLLFDRATLESQLHTVLPDAAVTITAGGASTASALDVFSPASDFLLDDPAAEQYSDVTADFSAPPAFCANPQSFELIFGGGLAGKYE